MKGVRELVLEVDGRYRVSALLMRPPDAWSLYVFAHGAGAGMRHAFMEAVAGDLAGEGVATLRFQFPYAEAHKFRPDPPALLESTVRAATARGVLENLPLFAGGKSMGGRMTSQAQAQATLPGVRGLVFLGFPLHPPRRPAVSRAKHLEEVSVPMLFVQGARDDLADLELIRGVCAALGTRAVLHVVEGGDHSFKVLKSSGRDQPAVMREIRDAVVTFMKETI